MFVPQITEFPGATILDVIGASKAALFFRDDTEIVRKIRENFVGFCLLLVVCKLLK